MKYSKEFKAKAIKLSDELGFKTACAQSGIAYYSLADLRKGGLRRTIPFTVK